MTEMKGASRDEDAIYFGRMVKRLRLQHGWTVEQLANTVGMTRVHVSVIERGGNSPKLRTFIALSNALGADPTEVLRAILQNRAQLRQATRAPRSR